MRKTFALGLALLLALAALTACGSDDGNTGGSTATDTAGSDTTGGSDSTGGSDATGDTSGDTAGLPGAVSECQNTADKTYLTTDQGGGKKGRDLAAKAASDCGLGCLNSPDPKACSVKCMKDDKGVTLSDNCAGCYGQIVLCTIENCAAQCIADSGAKICTDCQTDKGCTKAFYDCTGPLD